jgi:PAS domain S-box-containing protein
MHDDYYQKLINLLPIGYARCEIKVGEMGDLTDIVFVETNPAFLKISGLMVDDLAGLSVSELIPDIPKLIMKYGNHIMQASTADQAIEFDYFSLTQKRWLRVNASSPEIGYLVTLISDITREKNETPPEMESRLLQGFLDAMKDGSFVKDEACKYILTNQALNNLYGATADEIWGREDDAFLPPEAADACRISDMVAITEQKLVVTEEHVADMCFETSKFPVHLPNGEIGVGGIIRNITEAKLHKEALDLAQKQILDEKTDSSPRWKPCSKDMAQQC